MLGETSLGTYSTAFLLPTLLDYTVGGVALVAILNCAPLAPEMTDTPRRER